MKKRYLQILSGLFIILFMVLNPKEVFDAALLGLNAWWRMVFPALFPFFVGSHLLMGFGVVRFMGVLLEPIMRPLFNLPGAASFVMAMGFTSGTPIGAVITAKLREEQVLSKEESERVMSYCNNSSPLFMLAAISVGMFKIPALGIIIALAHYSANIVIGIILGLFSRKSRPTPFAAKKALWKRAFNELNIAYKQNPQPLGYFIGEAIKDSLQTLLLIGGFIVFFSVLIRILTIIGVIDLLSALLSLFLKPLGFSLPAVKALASGLFEITLGSKAASEANAPLSQQVVITGIILGWSGLAIHAQIATIIAKTDIKMKLFMISRIFHGILAGIFTWGLLQIISLNDVSPVFNNLIIEIDSYSWLETLQSYSLLFSLTMMVLIIASLLIQIIATLSSIKAKL